MVVGALGISVGLMLFGPKLIRLVGSEITKLNPMRAYCVALSAAVTVITSYSIHYTKLYDGGDRLIKLDGVDHGAVPVHRVGHLVDRGAFDHQEEALGVLRKLIKRGLRHVHKARITSYNVCYTKLLRLRPKKKQKLSLISFL